jgi:hypothetical protein
VHPSQWPNFVYEDGVAPAEGEDMWNGFLRHPLLVKVGLSMRNFPQVHEANTF